MSKEKNLVKRGQFYFIYDESDQDFLVEDKTKRGLPVVEKSIDESVSLIAEKGRFYDANGRGHIVPIRWYFPKQKFTLEKVSKFAETLESRYRAIMDLTCPDY
jgi:hypothetical protein